jgi:hypothetical protein
MKKSHPVRPHGVAKVQGGNAPEGASEPVLRKGGNA